MPGNLLRSALWYLARWRMNPIFTNIWKQPYTRWGGLYMADPLRPEEVEAEYRRIVSSGGKPAGVALVPTRDSRVVVLDIDRTDTISMEAVARIAGEFVVGETPRGGLRIAFSVPENSFMPGFLLIQSSFGDKIGEGGGAAKHMWNFPPGVACIEKKPDGRGCTRIGRYRFILPGGRRADYPWQLPWNTPPEWEWTVAREHLELVLDIKILEHAAAASTNGAAARPVTGKPAYPVPCWNTLSEFEEWLKVSGEPPLPACVARAIGADGKGKVRHGMRLILGAAAAMFLAACVAEVSVEELIRFVGENLEDFPIDEGGSLDRKLSYWLAEAHGRVIPRYAGLGALASSIPSELCESCRYRELCRRSGEEGGREVVYSAKPWLAYAAAFWEDRCGSARMRGWMRRQGALRF